MQNIHTQLAVVGGGSAGVTAAISSARLGIPTVLITDRPVLGGNSSSEIRVWTRGATGAGNLWAEEMGTWGMLKLENLYRNPDANPVFWDEVLLDAVLREPNLTLWLNTVIYDVTMDGNRITGLGGIQQGGEKVLFQAAAFIDATGDGCIGALTGVPFTVGSDSRETLGSSILYYTRQEDHPVPFVPPDYAYDMDHIEKILGSGGRIINPQMSGSDCWWFEYGGQMDPIKDVQSISLELRRLVLGVWNYVKNSGKFDADNYTLEWLGSIPGKRESRRMETAYCLTKEDILSRRPFPDGAFYGGWYMDTHPSGGIYDTGKDNCVQVPVPVYQIPLRCLFNEAVPNLFFAGRIIGVDRDVFFSSRVMNTCALSGQAAATMAAVCLDSGKGNSQLTAEDIRHVRRLLLREDMLIPGADEPDPEDRSPEARVTASSAHSSKAGQRSGRLELTQGGFLVFPALAGKTLSFEVHSAQTVRLTAECFHAKLPNCYCTALGGKTFHWDLIPGWQALTVPVREEDVFLQLRFSPAPGVCLGLCQRERVGFLCGQTGSPFRFEPRAWYEEVPLYAPAAILSAGSRPWGRPQAWIAAPEDLTPSLTLRWDSPVPVQEIRFFFDPDLAMELPSSHARHWEKSHLFAPRHGMPPQLVKDFALLGLLPDGTWKTLSAQKDQHQRLAVIPLEQAQAFRALRLDIRDTWGNLPPVLYKISVY